MKCNHPFELLINCKCDICNKPMDIIIKELQIENERLKEHISILKDIIESKKFKALF